MPNIRKRPNFGYIYAYLTIMHVNNWHPPTYLANTSLDKGHGHTSFQQSNGTYWNIVLQQLLLFCPQMLGFCVIVVVKNKKPLLDHTIQFIPPFFATIVASDG